MSYRPIQLWIKYFLLLASLGSLIFPMLAVAQSPDEGRIELALAGSDGSFIVQVAVPRGLSITEASLTIEGETIPMKADPVAIPETHWFILDASGNMLNTYATVSTAVKRFLQNTTAERVGIIIYNERVSRLNATGQSGEYLPFLDGYIAQPDAVGCVGDAFAELNELALSPESANRIILVAGQLTRQGTCQTETPNYERNPVDAILITDVVEDEYLDLVERSGGLKREANLRTIETRFNEVKVQWSDPIYILRGSMLGITGTSGSLEINFSNAQTVNYPLRLLPYTPPATPTPQVTQVSGLLGGATPTEIAQSNLSQIETPTASPTENTPQESAVESTPQESALESTPQESAVESTPQESTLESTPQESTLESTTPESTLESTPQESAVESTTQESTTPESTLESTTPESTAETTSESAEGINPILIVGGIGGLILLLAAAFLLLRPSRGRNPTIMVNPNIYESTYIVPQHNEGGASLFGKTEVVPQGGRPQLSAEDEALLTQVMTDDDFQTMRRQVGAHVVGLVKVHQNERLTGSYQLEKDGLTIGRNADNQIRIIDPRVSGNHAALEVLENGLVQVRTVSQTNSVMVRGTKVEYNQIFVLASQDVIQLTPNIRLIYLGREDAEKDGEDFQAPLSPKATLFDDGLTQL